MRPCPVAHRQGAISAWTSGPCAGGNAVVLHGPDDRPLHLLPRIRAGIRSAARPIFLPGTGARSPTGLDRKYAANFTNDYWQISLPNRLDTSSIRSPALFAYLAALNLLDAEVLFSDVRVKDLLDPAVAAPKSMERHHLFPKAYLASLDISGTRQVNAIANMAFLNWSENAKISGTLAREILASHDRPDQDPGKLKRQVHLHALPVGWEQLDYATFLDRRRSLMAQVVQEGFATSGATAGRTRRRSMT